MKNFIKSILIFVFILGLSACRKEIDRPQWDTQLVAPLLKTSLGLNNILKDSNYRLAKDSSIVLAFIQKLDSFSLNVLDTFTTKPFLKNVKISTLELVSDTIVYKITLGMLAKQMEASTDFRTRLAGSLILYNHGKLGSVPSQSDLSAGPLPLDISKWFQDAHLLSGDLKIKLTNTLPVDITNLQLQLNNKSITPLRIADVTFKNLVSGTSNTQLANLEGKHVEGNLSVVIPDIDIAGKDNVLIDTNSALIMVASISNVKVSEAIAIFPAQNVVEDRVEVPLGNTNGLELKETILKTATVRIEVYSTLDDTLFFSYNLPNAISPQNKSFSVNENVPPSEGKTGPSFLKEYKFDGYRLDLRGGPGKDTVNTFFSDLTGRIKQSLKPIYLSTNDSLDIRITMTNIRPHYIKGYIATDTIVKGENTLELFKSITGEKLDFEKANINLTIDNGFGVHSTVTTKFINSINKTGASVSLDDPTIVGIPKFIMPAKDNPFTPVQTIIITDKASPLISNFPEKFSYQFNIKTGNAVNGVKQYTDFAYEQSYFKPSVDISVPLSFSAKNLSLADTVSITPEFSSSIKNGQIVIIADNGFPLKASISMMFLDKKGIIIDQLVSPVSIEEAMVDPTSGRVKVKKKSKLVYNLDEVRIHNIQNAEKLMFKVIFDTKPEGKFVKLYADYKIDFKIVGDVTYKVQ